MKTIIQIPATLITVRALRYFVMNNESEVRHQTLNDDFYHDHPLRKKTLLDHKAVLKILKKATKTTKKADGPLDEHGKTLRTRMHGEVIYAYQFVETTTISDSRSKFGHEDTETEETSKLLSKKVFIFGKRVTRPKMKQWAAWVRGQIKLNPKDREEAVFTAKGLSIFTANGVQKALKKSKFFDFLKLGPATFIPYNTKVIEFKPLE